MLRNIALTGTYLINYILYADGFITQYTQYFQPQGVRHGFQAMCRLDYVAIRIQRMIVFTFHRVFDDLFYKTGIFNEEVLTIIYTQL